MKWYLLRLREKSFSQRFSENNLKESANNVTLLKFISYKFGLWFLNKTEKNTLDICLLVKHWHEIHRYCLFNFCKHTKCLLLDQRVNVEIILLIFFQWLNLFHKIFIIRSIFINLKYFHHLTFDGGHKYNIKILHKQLIFIICFRPKMIYFVILFFPDFNFKEP